MTPARYGGDNVGNYGAAIPAIGGCRARSDPGQWCRRLEACPLAQVRCCVRSASCAAGFSAFPRSVVRAPP